MSSFFNWLLGPDLYQKTSLVTRAQINFWLGRSIEKGGSMAVSAGEIAVEDQMRAVQALSEALSYQQAAVTAVGLLLDERVKKVKDLTSKIQVLVDSENEDEALILVEELETIENSIPEIKGRLESSQKDLEAGRDRLQRQQAKLRRMQAQQESNATTLRINETLEKASEMMNSVQIQGEQTLDKATEALRRKSDALSALSDIQTEGETIDKKVKKLSAQNRLARFKKTNS